ncbi:7802_t:CDS:2, partial [Dentiscutata erythropus]
TFDILKCEVEPENSHPARDCNDESFFVELLKLRNKKTLEILNDK